MSEHDPRCEGGNDEKVLADVAEFGWHLVKILERSDSPGWAFSIGLYQTFNHPEVVVFGLNGDLMHSVISSIGEDLRTGKKFEIDGHYNDLIEAYSCTFKPVSQIWYYPFLGYANWFYGNMEYPVIQCIWPDKNSRFPWDSQFNPNWTCAQPLLFNQDPETARTEKLLQILEK